MLSIAGQMIKTVRITQMLFALLVLSGCESFPLLTDSTPEAGAVQAPAPAAGDRRAGRAREETHDLRRAIDQLQDGQLQQGRTGLVNFLERNPANQTARSLLRQIDTDPKALLGEEYTLYTVRPGDTLGELAERLLGDALSFLALARYNDIQRPRALHVGQTLRIPVTRSRDAEPAAPADEGAVKAAVEPALAPVLEFEPTAEPGDAPVQGDSAAASGESSVPSAERIAHYHQAAVAHLRNQELEEAIALWDRVLALDPNFEPAWGYRTRAQELKRRLDALDTAP